MEPAIPLFYWHYVNTNNPQAISSLILAIEMIIQYCKKLKYKRRIVLVTDGNGPMDADGIDAIVSKVKEEHIEMTILYDITNHPSHLARNAILTFCSGVDFDDPEFGFKEEDKDAVKVSMLAKGNFNELGDNTSHRQKMKQLCGNWRMTAMGFTELLLKQSRNWRRPV